MQDVIKMRSYSIRVGLTPKDWCPYKKKKTETLGGGRVKTHRHTDTGKTHNGRKVASAGAKPPQMKECLGLART